MESFTDSNKIICGRLVASFLHTGSGNLMSSTLLTAKGRRIQKDAGKDLSDRYPKKVPSVHSLEDNPCMIFMFTLFISLPFDNTHIKLFSVLCMTSISLFF